MRRIILVLGLALAAAGVAAAQGWQDDFDGEILDMRWTWRVPAEGPVFSLTERPGWLRIGVPQRENGYNHWNNPQADDAPQLRAVAPPGDWQLEARVQLMKFDPANHLHVGLVVGTGDAQLLSLGLLMGPGLPGGPKVPEVWFEPTGNSGFAKLPGEAVVATLRLTKAGNTYRAQVRRGEGDWEQVGTYALAEEPVFAGLIGKTFSNGPGIVFDVDYLSLKPVEAGGAAQEAKPAEPAAAAPATPAPAAPKPEAPKPAEPAATAILPATPTGGSSGALDSAGAELAASPSAQSRGAAVASPSPEAVSLAKRLCDLGDRCLRQKRYGDAEVCYRVVLLHLPQSPRAQSGMKRARAAGR